MALLFTDIVGSTAMLHDLGEVYGDVLDEHDRLLRQVWREHGGIEVDNEGDAFFVVFDDHERAVAAAADVVRRSRAHTWPGGADVRIRVSLHSGEPRVRGTRYWGVDVNYAARLCRTAHGGQVIVSAALRSVVPDLPVESLGEHGVKDFPTPRELFHLVVDGSVPDDFPPPQTPNVVRSNLPTVANPIFGRDDMVADLADRVGRQDVRAITVTGPGGVGKTRLALAVGEQVAGTGTAVLFVELAGVLDLEAATQAAADAVGVPSGVPDLRAAVARHLADEPTLLILDNAEHLPELPELVRDLLTHTSRLWLLVTSQAPLHVRGEQVVPLQPLELPAPRLGDAAEIAASPAVRMFVSLAAAQHPDFRLTQANAAEIGELVRAVEGVPLALELAAARAPVIGVPRLTAALAGDDEALGRGPRDLPPRQRGLSAALAWTISLLSDRERTVFAGLGAFAGAWSVDWAEHLFASEIEPAETWEVLVRLTEVSLVTQRGDGRFSMAERVRRQARQLLTASGREAHWRRRHAHLLVHEVAGTTADILFDWDRLVADVEDAVDEVLHAADWAANHDPDTLRELLAAFTIPLSECVGLVALRELAQVVDDERACLNREDALFGLAKARLLSLAADTLAHRVDLVGSIIECLEVHGTVEDLVLAAEFQFDGLLFSGAVGDAERLARGLLDRPAVAADPRLRVLVSRWLVTLYLETGNGGEAEALLDSIEAEGAVLPEQEAHTAHLRGDAALESQRYREALGWYARALRGSPETGFLWSVWTVQSMAACWAAAGFHETAVELLEAVRATHRKRIGTELVVPVALRGLVEAPYEKLSPESLAYARGRGAQLDYPAWRLRALELADELSVSG